MFAVAWEFAGSAAGARFHAFAAWGWARGFPSRRFGFERIVGCATGGSLAVLCLPVVPGRMAPFLLLGGLAAGLLGPDAWQERKARRRARAFTAALPDALDLIAVGVAAGRTPIAMLGEIGRAGEGVLAEELANVAAAADCGTTQQEALAELRDRVGAPALGALTMAMERSQRYGSPLAEQLHAQAADLRVDERRRIGEQAARAAPKIQLVVAMVLVPSVLLAIAAAIVAHSDALFGGI